MKRLHALGTPITPECMHVLRAILGMDHNYIFRVTVNEFGDEDIWYDHPARTNRRLDPWEPLTGGWQIWDDYRNLATEAEVMEAIRP